MHTSYALSRHHRRQGGFIQGTILFALAILGVIIAAFAVSNTGSNTNTDTERDRVNAGVILKGGSDLQDGFSRALGDNWQAPNVALTGTTAASAAPPLLNLYDNAYKYAVAPRLPDQAFADGSAEAFTATNIHTGLGASTEERVVTLGGLKASVCRRINNLVAGTPWDATATIPASEGAAHTANASEGCYVGTAPAHIYYRVVAVDSGS
jgi:hypothetical protein